MKNFRILLFLAFFGFVLSQDSETRPDSDSCREDEEWRQCSGCERTCDNPNPVCPKICQPPKCMCKRDTVRTLVGSCVPVHECPSNTVTGNSSTTHDEPTCPENEGIKTCSGCEPSCDVPRPVCTKICRQTRTCECIQGKFRNKENNKCVEVSECPLDSAARKQDENTTDGSCGENEELRSCPGCEPECSNLMKPCPLICNPGKACECKSGYARNAAGKCVKQEECPPGSSESASRAARATFPEVQCGENEAVTQCSGCEADCGHLDRMCTMMCNGIVKCECAPGFARDQSSGKCVKREDCPVSNTDNSTCGENEELRSCPGCEPQCDDLMRPCLEICRVGQACECKSGYARTSDGKCVKQEECPVRNTNSTCGKNEELRSCPGCEPTCNNPNPICPMICRLGEECQCKQGFVRNSANECVLESECSLTPSPTPLNDGDHVCPKHERYTTCGSCEGTCGNPNPMCTLECKPAGCYCNKRNFVRGPKGHCIPKALCSKRAGNLTKPRDDDGLTNPCAATLCMVGTVCKVTPVMCVKAPCPPQATCVPIEDSVDDNPIIRNPFCEVARCANGPCLPVAINCKNLKNCEYVGQCIDRNFNGADFDVCENSTCPENSKCEAEVIQCFAPPCLNIPKCVPIKQRDSPIVDDPCEALDCRDGQICEKSFVQCVTEPCPPIARCVDIKTPDSGVPDDPCIATTCPVGTICTKVQVNCIIAPCLPISSCVNITTPDSGVPDDPCIAMTCPVGTICTKVQVNCIRAPCPPIGRCVDQADVSKIRNTRDVESDTVKSPSCENMNCPKGTKCTFLPINCLRSPCPGSVPHCVPLLLGEPLTPPPREIKDVSSLEHIPNRFCSRVRCAHCVHSGIQCDSDGSNCEYLGKCVGLNSDPASIDVCANSKCPTGQHCIAQEIQCFAPPCFPIPTCVPDSTVDDSESP